MTVFATAMTCGTLLALAAEMLSARFGIALPGIRLALFSTNTQALHGALGWWTIAGAGFVGSFLAGRLAQDDAADRRGRRLAIGGLLFVALAAAPYFAVAAPAASLTDTATSNLVAFGLGTVTAFCGSWFAAPR